MIDIEQLPPERSISVERREALREVLMAEVRRSRPWWRRSRRAATVGVGAIGLVLVGGAATAYVAFQPASDTYSVVCYSEPSVDGDANSVRVASARAVSSGETSATESGSVGDPISACAGLWEQGVIGVEPSEAGADPKAARPGRVPQLVSCTMEDGTAGVFPGDADTCRALGLPMTTGSEPR